MRPGIIIQHAREIVREGEIVRSDIAGVIAVVPRERWPDGVGAGDFLEMTLSRWSDLADSPGRGLFDRVSSQAIRQFFLNGGQVCRLFGLCIETEEDLILADPRDTAQTVFDGLLDRLRGQEDLGILLMPCLSWLPCTVSADRVEVPATNTMVLLMLHCLEMNNRFAVLDAPRDLHDQALMKWVQTLRDVAPEASSYGAIYYPWLMNGDETFGPAGSVAGVFARTDTDNAPFGVRWPPANQALRGVTHTAIAVRWGETDALTAAHINPILAQPTRGVVVWGARTLSRDSKWMHINARRIVSMVSEQIRRDSEWVVFENQRPELWEIVARSVRGRLDQLWTAGLLTGDQAGSEYEVQCDAETNPLEVRDAGQIHVRVTLRPISTAEFIVVELRLGQ